MLLRRVVVGWFHKLVPARSLSIQILTESALGPTYENSLRGVCINPLYNPLLKKTNRILIQNTQLERFVKQKKVLHSNKLQYGMHHTRLKKSQEVSV